MVVQTDLIRLLFHAFPALVASDQSVRNPQALARTY